MKKPDDYADRVLREALLGSTLGLDVDVAQRAVDDMLHAWAQAAQQLRDVTVPGRTVTVTCKCKRQVVVELPAAPEALARAASHMAKGMDEVSRLTAFAKGQPDSRPDRDSRDVLRHLTMEQLAQVTRWVEENAIRG